MLRSFKQGPGSLIVNKTTIHYSACSIIDEGNQGTGRSSSFKPGMGRAIKLNQFAKTGTSIPVRMNIFDFLLFGQPEIFLCPTFPYCFVGKRDTMEHHQLFRSQSRSKI